MKAMKRVCGPLVRISLTVVSISNILLAWLLLGFCEWAKASIDELLPGIYYLGQTMVHTLASVALFAFAALVYLWILVPAYAAIRGNRDSNSTATRVLFADGMLLIMSLTSYLALVVAICSVVLANTKYNYVPCL